MHRSESAPAKAHTVRSNAIRGAALALAFATAIGGTALLTRPAPATEQGQQVITQTTFTELAEKVTPAVVAIRVEGSSPADESGGEWNLPPDHPFNEFFKRFFGDEQGFQQFERRFGNGDNNGGQNWQFRSRPHPRLSQGSGFIISPDGYVVTNDHVVDGGDSITVVTNDDQEYQAEVIGTDPRTDLAVLKISAPDPLPYVEFSETEAKVGDWVVAVGNPFGLGGTVTSGIISARGRTLGNGTYTDFLQIDAAVNRGNSGGPTFTLDGKVAGVNTAIYTPNGGSVGIGFAIPASTASSVVNQLIEHGQITRGWLGVSIQTVTPDIAQSVGLDKPAGAIVAEVFTGSPAEAAGIVPGDIVLDVDGQKIDSSRDLARVIADFAPGKTAHINIYREHGEQTVDVEIGTMPENPRVASSGGSENSQPRGNATQDRLADLGLRVAPASEVDNDSNARGVVVTDVLSGSEADDKGISPGDRILRVSGVEVNTPEELNKALTTARDDGLSNVLVLLRSQNGQRFVTLELARA